MFFAVSFLSSLLVGSAVVTNLIDAQNLRHDLSAVGQTFDITAPVIAQLFPDKGLLLLGDRHGVCEFANTTTVTGGIIKCGDVVRVCGTFRPAPSSPEPLWADCESVEILSHGPPPRPRPITTQEFLRGTCDLCLCELTGTVKDVFRDELDTMFTFLVLLSDNETIYVPVRFVGPTSAWNGYPPIGSEVSLVGVPMRMSPLNRRHLGRYFIVHDPTSIRILKPAPADSFQLPDLRDVLSLRPQEISRLGRRHALGQVLCAMRGNTFLLRAAPNLIVRVETNGPDLPSPGENVEVIGYPESNLYHIDLVRSTWRPSRAASRLERENAIPAEIVLAGGNGPVSASAWHGKLVRLSGHLLNTPESDSPDRLLRLEWADQIVPVDVSSLSGELPGLVRGCTIEIVGICVLDFETWRPNAAFPRIRGFTIVPRAEADIRVIARPSWWTTQRLLVLLCILAPIITGSVILNFFLRRLVERRSRALLREQSAKLAEALRVDERTRLAAELHDSVAQDLTGISMQIETAEDLAADAPEKLRRILGMASRSLLNCRTELRDCLWDLRSHALDEQNMGDAIARTLKPHLEGAGLALRFNVPRQVVSDATVHATLQIIRELTANAIRHGHAKHLRICGAIDGSRLMFSVADDGCGFDPDTAPGVSHGHFGLSGIRERVRKLGGTIAIRSSPKNGTKVSITL